MTCDVLSRYVTQHVTPWVSCQCLTQPLLATNHNKIYQSTKLLGDRKSITGHTMGLTLALLLKYLAQCETINYVWYFQERVWWPGRSALTYLELATQLVEVSIFKKLLIWTYVRAVNTQLTTAVHMKYDSNKLQQNHFYMCNIDIIANTMQHF